MTPRNDEFQFRENNYFNDSDLYEFDNNLKTIVISKATMDMGCWWLGRYKATSVKSRKVKQEIQKL